MTIPKKVIDFGNYPWLKKGERRPRKKKGEIRFDPPPTQQVASVQPTKKSDANRKKEIPNLDDNILPFRRVENIPEYQKMDDSQLNPKAESFVLYPQLSDIEKITTPPSQKIDPAVPEASKIEDTIPKMDNSIPQASIVEDIIPPLKNMDINFQQPSAIENVIPPFPKTEDTLSVQNNNYIPPFPKPEDTLPMQNNNYIPPFPKPEDTLPMQNNNYIPPYQKVLYVPPTPRKAYVPPNIQLHPNYSNVASDHQMGSIVNYPIPNFVTTVPVKQYNYPAHQEQPCYGYSNVQGVFNNGQMRAFPMEQMVSTTEWVPVQKWVRVPETQPFVPLVQQAPIEAQYRDLGIQPQRNMMTPQVQYSTHLSPVEQPLTWSQSPQIGQQDLHQNSIPVPTLPNTLPFIESTPSSMTQMLVQELNSDFRVSSESEYNEHYLPSNIMRRARETGLE